MRMYTILYHKSVWKYDYKGLNETERRKITKYINQRLTTYPEKYGKALTGNLKGYYRLRIDDFRVIYRINKSEITVFVVQVGFRRNAEAYIKAAKRLRLI